MVIFGHERGKPMADVNVNFEIDSEYRDKLKKIAEDNYRSMGSQIRLVLEQWLEKQK